MFFSKKVSCSKMEVEIVKCQKNKRVLIGVKISLLK